MKARPRTFISTDKHIISLYIKYKGTKKYACSFWEKCENRPCSGYIKNDIYRLLIVYKLWLGKP